MDLIQMLPITDSIWRCFIVIALILFVPYISHKLRFPQIAGLIIAGMCVGSGGTGIIVLDDVLALCNKIGLLFIMFFAGLDMELEEMKKTGLGGLLFGIITFIIPFAACYYSGVYILETSKAAALIIGCIMGSHTLISYTIVSKYGLSKEPGVTIAVTGALIAILLALVINSFIRSAFADDTNGFNIWIFILKFAIYIATIILLFPRAVRLFFNRFGSGYAHFLFIFFLLLLSSGLASTIGLEGILGAFLAGLVLGRYIPQSSPLMNRIDFIGNTLFVPIFLLSTGMMIDIRELITNPKILLYFAIFFSVGTIGKWVAAFISQKVGGIDRDNRLLIFGLSEAHAAGALAIAMGAYSLSIISNTLLSTVIMIVLFSCLLSNIITEHGAKKLNSRTERADSSNKREKMMVLVHNPKTTSSILNTAIALQSPRKKSELLGVHITINGLHADKYMQIGKKLLDEASHIAASADVPFQPHNRLGNNVIDSITHISQEHGVTDILLGLADMRDITMKYYNDFILTLIARNRLQTIFMRIPTPINMIRRIVVIIPELFNINSGLFGSIEYIYRLRDSIGCSTDIYCHNTLVADLRNFGKRPHRTELYTIHDVTDMGWIMDNIKVDHLLILIGPRDNIMHGTHPFIQLYEHIQSMQIQCNIMLLFPEDNNTETTNIEQATNRTDRDLLKLLRT